MDKPEIFESVTEYSKLVLKKVFIADDSDAMFFLVSSSYRNALRNVKNKIRNGMFLGEPKSFIEFTIKTSYSPTATDDRYLLIRNISQEEASLFAKKENISSYMFKTKGSIFNIINFNCDNTTDKFIQIITDDDIVVRISEIFNAYEKDELSIQWEGDNWE